MTIILAGMHRSGTSMFARYMHESGIKMGEDFYVDQTSNKYGHFEDLDFLKLHRNELARQCQGEDYLVFDDFPVSLDFVKWSKKLYREKAKMNQGKPWGWKDPRTTIFLHHWQAIDPEAAYIFMVRKPEDVINSLCRLLKTKWSVKQKSIYLKTYIYYNSQINIFLKKHQFKNMAVVGFDPLIADPKTTLKNVSAQVGFDFDDDLFRKLFDDRVISSSQGINFRFLKKQFREAQNIYNQLSRHFS
jgi:hypothetical protein